MAVGGRAEPVLVLEATAAAAAETAPDVDNTWLLFSPPEALAFRVWLVLPPPDGAPLDAPGRRCMVEWYK